ncbi:hypothetical protein ES705_19132 [subsurface metagenome]
MKYFFYTLLFVFLLSACSGIKVVTDYDKSIDFSQYKTFEYYGWAEESDKILNRFDKERIEESFGEEFKKRELEYVEENGDMVVVLFIVVEEKTQKSASTTQHGGYGGYYGGYYGYGPGYGWGPSYSTTTVSEYDYQVGTLVIDVFDAKEQKLIWEGIGTKTVDENPQTRDKNIPRAVAAIMKQFPVQPIQEK